MDRACRVVFWTCQQVVAPTKTEFISEDLRFPITETIDILSNGSLTVTLVINFHRHRPVDHRNCAPQVAESEFSPRAPLS